MRIIGLFCWWAMVAAIAQAQDTFTLTLLHRDLASAMGNKPVGNSPLVLREQGSEKVYKATTDMKGQAVLTLPVGRNFWLSLDCEHCETMEPIEVRCADAQAGMRMTFGFQEYSAAYYRKAHENKLAEEARQKAEEEARAKQEAELARRAAEEEAAWEREEAAEEAARQARIESFSKSNVLFYLVLSDEVLVHKVAVYADDTKKKSYGDTGGYYYQGTACMASLTNNPEGAAHNHHPKAGTYKYYALSDDGKYEWRGTYTISEGKTTAVALRLSDAVRRKK